LIPKKIRAVTFLIGLGLPLYTQFPFLGSYTLDKDYTSQYKRNHQGTSGILLEPMSGQTLHLTLAFLSAFNDIRSNGP